MNFMKITWLWVFLFLLIPSFLQAENQRLIPLDMYLIVDATEGLREVRSEVVAWINEDVIERRLQPGDRLMIWSAGDTAALVHSETVGSQKNTAKGIIENLEIRGRRADFSTAVQEAASRERETTGEGRMSYVLVVSSSVGNLAQALGGSSAPLFRWSRAERSSRWQAMVVAPNIAERVRQAATAYMNSF